MSEDVAKDVAEMNDLFDAILKPPASTEEKSDEPKEEPKDEEVEPKEETVVPEDKEEKSTEPEPKVDEKVPDEKDKAIADLRNEIAALQAKVATPPKPEEKPDIKPALPDVSDQDFIGDLDLDEVTRDSKEFNKVLNNIYKKARLDGEQAIISRLPELITSQVNAINTMQKAVEEFYTANEDLKAFSKVVSVVTQELAQGNKEQTLDNLMTNVESEVRKRLSLPRKAAEKKEDPPKKEVPRLPGKSSSAGKSTTETKIKSLESELEEMNKVIGR